MKILALSDTHGKLDKVRDIWPKLTDIDMIIHAGDFIRDGKALSKELKVPVVTVKGNCDNGYSHDDFETVATEYGDILVTHGHMENVKYRLDNLLYKALENDCRAVVFGHTHRAFVGEDKGIHLINPGSLTLPRDGSDGSYAIIRTSKDSFDASIVYYSTIMGGRKPPQSGFLRNLMNYCDRF